MTDQAITNRKSQGARKVSRWRRARGVLVLLMGCLALAAVFIFHGYALVSKSWGTAWNPDLPVVQQALVAWGQLLGGLAMLLGFLTRLAALALIAIMAGAIALIHWPHGFDITKGGYEYNVVIITICLVLVLTGPGKIAADQVFRVRPRV